MIYVAGETAYVYFTTNSSTGAAANADSTPTASVLKNGSVDGAVSVTVTNSSTGAYVASFTVPGSGYSVGDEVAVLVSATISGVAGKLFTGIGKVDVLANTRLASASYTAPLDAAGTRSAVGLASANLDTQLATIDDLIDTEMAAVKAKTDNLPSDPADASVIAGRFDTLETAIAALPTSTDPYAVLGLHTIIGETEEDFVTAYDGDDRSVAIYFRDAAGNPAAIPTGATAVMLDATGASVGTATISDSKTAVGYLLIRLQVPSSGNRPTSLQVSFSGGSGAAYKHRVPMVVTA